MKAISKIFNFDLTKIAGSLLATVKSIFDYLLAVKRSSIEKAQKKEDKKTNDELKDICDKGTLQELLDR